MKVKVYYKKGDQLRKVRWFSSLPDKHCSTLMEKLNQLTPEEWTNKDTKIVIEDPAKTESEKPKTGNFFKQKSNSISYSLKRLSSAKPEENPRTIKVPIPFPPKPKYHHPRKLISREGKPLIVTGSSLDLDTPTYQPLLEEEVAKNNPMSTKKYYFVKYLGINNGQLGIATTKIPIPRQNSGIFKVQKKLNASSGYIDQDVPQRKKALANCQTPPLQKPNILTRPAQRPSTTGYVNPKAQKGVVADFQRIIHQYSFPRALLTQKKQNVVSQSELIEENKYSKDNIGLAIHNKIAGTQYLNSNKGFKGHSLTTADIRRVIGFFRRKKKLLNNTVLSQEPNSVRGSQSLISSNRTLPLYRPSNKSIIFTNQVIKESSSHNNSTKKAQHPSQSHPVSLISSSRNPDPKT